MPTQRWRYALALVTLACWNSALADRSIQTQGTKHVASAHEEHSRKTAHQETPQTVHPQASDRSDEALPTLAGHYAFATLAEIVALLEADPQTDWRTVDLESLRQHLIDMDRVTLSSTVESSPLDTGMRFSVTSTDPATIASIQRMTRAHAGMQNTAADAAANPAAGGDDAGNTITPFWRYTVQGLDNGVVMTVSTDDASSIQRMRGLGFIGILVSGMHHQAHHWSMAKGANPHTH